MKAVVLHGPGDLRVEEVADATLPAGGLLLRTVAAGICGSDVRTWRHGSSRLAGAQVLGHEIAGVVLESDASAFPVGTSVAVCPGAPCLACRACDAGHANLCRRRQVLGYDLPGGMAERVAVPSDWIRTGGVVTLDPVRPVEAGAIVEPLHTVVNGQDQAAVGPDLSVLVLGLGPIGVLHAALARSTGASRVVAVDPEPARVALARTVLGDGAGDVAERMTDGWQDRARESLGGHGFDVVIVATGSPAAVGAAIELTEPGGRILAFAGLPAGSSVVGIDLNLLHYRQLSIVGAFGGTPRSFQQAAAWLDRTDFDAAAFTPLRFPLSDAVAAFESVGRGEGLKTLLLVD